jgi:hypothetical protein
MQMIGWRQLQRSWRLFSALIGRWFYMLQEHLWDRLEIGGMRMQQAEYHLAGVSWQLLYLSHPFRGNQA